MEANSRKTGKLSSSKTSLRQSVMGACTNLVYKFGGISKMPEILARSPSKDSQVWIIGQRYSNKQAAKERLRRILWFTYRDKVQITQDLNSDVGWGCLPRVGQMVIAQALIRNLEFKGKKLGAHELQAVIELFIDENKQNAIYSLSNILKYARWKFSISPGQWFNVGQIVEVLKRIQEQSPAKGTENLKVLFYSQSVIFQNSIVDRAGLIPCDCAELKQGYCQFCHKQLNKIVHEADSRVLDAKEPPQTRKEQLISDIYQIRKAKVPGTVIMSPWFSQESPFNQPTEILEPASESKAPENQFKNHLLLIVSTRLGEKCINQEDMRAVIDLLELKSSIGAIGGITNKAFYLVGHDKQEIVYLDPHYVQSYVCHDSLSQSSSTFFCEDYRTLNRKKLDPSIAFCYYIRTAEDYEQLKEKIQCLRRDYERKGRDFFISIFENDCCKSSIKIEKISSGGKSSIEDSIEMSHEYQSLEFKDIMETY